MSATIKTSISQYIANIKEAKVLTKDEFYQLHAEYRNGDLAAKEKMVRHNLRLVISIASKYATSDDRLLELIQEGNVGLMTAIEKFDSSRGYAFSTYAVTWIKERILYFLNTNAKIVKVPVDMMKLSRKIKKMTDEDPSLTPEAIAKALNKTVGKVIAAQKIHSKDLSFEATYGSNPDEERGTLPNLIGDEVDVAETIAAESSKKWLNLQVSKLPEKQRMAICFAFGLNNHEPLNGEEIGKAMNLTRERARQLLKAGTAALAQAAARDGMTAEAFL